MASDETTDSSKPTPRAYEQEGRAAADPISIGIGKRNCRSTLALNRERVRHFIRRMHERGSSPERVVVVLLNVNEPHGKALADILMPRQDWQAIRDQGQAPFVRGLATREGLMETVELLDAEAGEKLRLYAREEVVVVMDHGTVEVFKASECESPNRDRAAMDDAPESVPPSDTEAITDPAPEHGAATAEWAEAKRLRTATRLGHQDR